MERKMFYLASSFEFKKAAFLREHLTTEEKLLWEKLKKKQLMGLRFKCQHPIRTYIADFYCHSIKLVIEIDGKNHNRASNKLNDKLRTADLKKLGISVLRYSNDQVRFSLDLILREISEYARTRLGDERKQSERRIPSGN
jgi:very-short-patch-repair endonuclease